MRSYTELDQKGHDPDGSSYLILNTLAKQWTKQAAFKTVIPQVCFYISIVVEGFPLPPAPSILKWSFYGFRKGLEPRSFQIKILDDVARENNQKRKTKKNYEKKQPPPFPPKKNKPTNKKPQQDRCYMMQVLNFLPPPFSSYLWCSGYTFKLQIIVFWAGGSMSVAAVSSQWGWTFSYVTAVKPCSLPKNIKHSVDSDCVARNSYSIHMWGVIYLLQHRFCFGDNVWLLNNGLTPSLSPSFLVLHWRGKNPQMSILLSLQFWILVQSLCNKSFDSSSQNNFYPKQELRMLTGLKIPKYIHMCMYRYSFI